MKPKKKPIFVLLSFAIVGLLVLAACTTSGGQNNPDNAAPTTSEESASEATPEDRAPDFEITTYQGAAALGGETVQLHAVLDQGKPVVLNFWAGLCPPCRLEMPDFQEVYDEYQDKVVLLGVDVGPFTNLGSREDGQALVEELGVTYPIGTTTNSNIIQQYQVVSMPSTYFITPDGEIVRTWAGLLNEEKLSELIDELLAASS